MTDKKENITSDKAWEIHANVRHKDYYVTTEVAWEIFRWNKDSTYTFKELREAAINDWRKSEVREKYYKMWNSSEHHRKEVYPAERDMSNHRARMIGKLKQGGKQ